MSTPDTLPPADRENCSPVRSAPEKLGSERSLYAQHLDSVQGPEDGGASAEALDEALGAWYGETLPASPNARILDFGCGKGVLLRWLKGRGFDRLEALDIIGDYRSAIEETSGATVHVVDDGVEFLAERAEHYDAIYCLDVLEHVERSEAERIVAAFARALRPGGRLIIAGPHAATPGGVYTRYLDWTHTNCFTVASLDQLLRSAGLPEGKAVVPRFHWGLKPTRWALQIARKVQFAWRRANYTLEMPGDPTMPPHFYMRLVVWSQKSTSDR